MQPYLISFRPQTSLIFRQLLRQLLVICNRMSQLTRSNVFDSYDILVSGAENSQWPYCLTLYCML